MKQSSDTYTLIDITKVIIQQGLLDPVGAQRCDVTEWLWLGASHIGSSFHIQFGVESCQKYGITLKKNFK